MHRLLNINLLLMTSLLIADEGSISGQVQDLSEPLPGANVFLVGTSMGATTDSLGQYIISKVPVGKYTISVGYIGYETSTMEVYVSATDAGSQDDMETSFSSKLGLDEVEEMNEIVKGNQLKNINFILVSSAVGLNEIVVSAAKVQQKITEAPSVVAVVNNRTIRRRTGVDDFNRLASFVKGVDVIYYGVQGAQINARGFDGGYSTRFRQYTDGLYIGEAVSGQVYSVISGPPKEAISRIEVLFGPQAALYGPDASQGLLNIITKTPKTDDKNEFNFSVSNINRYRFGGRFTETYDKIAFDISGSATRANELPYGNSTSDSSSAIWIFDRSGTPQMLNEDYYAPLEVDRTHVRATGYYYLTPSSELSVFYNYIMGRGYAMGSLGPIYNRDMNQGQYGIKYNNRNHSFRITTIDQIASAQFRHNLGLYQVSNRDANDQSLPWDETLDAYEKDSTTFWLKFNSKDVIVDYQYNKRFSDRLQLVTGFDYEFKDPDTKRTAIADRGEDPFYGGVRGDDLNEYRYGVYGQIEKKLIENIALTGSIRFDGHEYYGDKLSPRVALVHDSFMNGSLKLIAGTGFKAPTFLERNILSGVKNYFSGTVEQGFPIDFVTHAIVTGAGNHGFTVLEFKDKDGNGIYGENDSLMFSNYFGPLKLEELQSIELAYTGLFDKKNMISINGYIGNYKNFKGPLTLVGSTGPGWNPFVDFFGPLENDEVRQVNFGDNLVSDEQVPPYTLFYSYQTLPIDVMFLGIDGGWKHLGSKYEFEMNFSYFNDDDLNEKRDKGKKYENYLSYPDSLEFAPDSIHSGFYDYRRVYSNTSNFKASLVFTSLNTFVKGLTTSISLKYNAPYDFVSGDFQATAEGQDEQYLQNSSFNVDPGQMGGGIYADLDMSWVNGNLHYGFSVKNIFETQINTFPLSPKIPRSFEFETGYRF